MSRKGTTGESRLWFVPTIASASLIPTAAEITAGTDLTPNLTRDGFDAPINPSLIDASDAANRLNKQVPGNIDAGNLTIKGYRDSVSGSDTFHTVLAQDVAGYIVERPFGGSTVAAAAAQKVNVWKGFVAARAAQGWGDEPRKDVVTFAAENSAYDVTVT